MRIIAPILLGVGIASAAAVDDLQLPDGAQFQQWQNTTVYSRTYHVDRQNPAATDAGAGDAQTPFKTIGKAAQVVTAGQRVVIHAGIYREFVQPAHQGTGPSAMICFQANPGDSVIISGSRVYQGTWTRKSGAIYETTPASSFFGAFPNPFAVNNLTAYESTTNPWTSGVVNQWPQTGKRGMIWQQGRRLVQVSSTAGLSTAGTYWVSADGATIQAHLYGDANPASTIIELSVQEQLFEPPAFDFGYIEVRGLIFQHAANSFRRIGSAAVSANGGHHWIFVNNTFREINSAGLDFGFEAREWMEADYPYNRTFRSSHIVRANTFQACGTAGIRSMCMENTLVEDNLVGDIGWWNAEQTWETAGIKLLMSTGTIVRRNVIHATQGAQAIWMDWEHVNSRLTRNVCYDIEASVHGAILVEGTVAPVWIDHNVIWNVTGHGVVQVDGSGMTVAHNFIGTTTKPGFNNWVNPGRKGDGTGNRILNNIFSNSTVAFGVSGTNTSDYNLFFGWGLPQGVTFDQHSTAATGTFTWTAQPATRSLVLALSGHSQALPQAPWMTGVSAVDFFGTMRSGTTTAPGPFAVSRFPQSQNVWPLPTQAVAAPGRAAAARSSRRADPSGVAVDLAGRVVDVAVAGSGSRTPGQMAGMVLVTPRGRGGMWR